VSAVANRRSSEIFLKRFEEISLWMRKKPDPVTADLDHRINKHGIDPDTARKRSLKLLDTRLAARSDPWSQLGLTHDALKRDVRELRQAYDQIEAAEFVYKPRRAPRVANPDKRMSKEWQEIATANRRRPGNLRSAPSRPPLATRLRRRLGDAERFKRRVVLTLVVAGLLYAVVLIHSVYTDLPTTTIRANTHTTISQ